MFSIIERTRPNWRAGIEAGGTAGIRAGWAAARGGARESEVRRREREERERSECSGGDGDDRAAGAANAGSDRRGSEPRGAAADAGALREGVFVPDERIPAGRGQAAERGDVPG